MRTHVTQTTSGCFSAFHKIRSVWRSLPSTVIQTMVMSLVLSLWRCDARSLPAYRPPLRRLQSTLTTTARSLLVCRVWRTSAQRLPTFIGFVPLKASSSNWKPLSSSRLGSLLVATFPLTSSGLLMSTTSFVFNQQSHHSTIATVNVDDRAFPVVGTNLWNGLPDELTSVHYSLNSLYGVNSNCFCFARHILTSPV